MAPGALVLIAFCVAAQTPFTEDAMLTSPTASLTEDLGADVALDGNTALLGLDIGAAHVFVRQPDGSWQEDQVLQTSQAGLCGYGYPVALDSGRAIVADTFYGSGAFCDGIGLLTPFYHDGLVFRPAPVLFNGSGSNYGFGRDIAIASNVLLVGADGNANHTGFADSGSAAFYLQSGNAWSLQQSVSGSDTALFDFFGASVALDAGGTTAVVGAPGHGYSIGNSGYGAAYVFQFDGSEWSEVQKLMASDAALNDFFGRVALQGNVLVVSSSADDGQFPNMGSVYVFRHDGTQWVETQNIAANHPMASGQFGSALAFDGLHLAVGAAGHKAIYVYRDVGSSFVFVQQFVASSPATFGALGGSVDIDGNTCLAGAPGASVPGVYSGAAYAFTIQELALTADASVVQAGQTLTLTTHGGLPGTPCVLQWQLRTGGSSALGGPQFGILAGTQGVFDAEGAHVLTLSIPSGLSGSMIRLTTQGPIPPGVVGHSNPVSVLVQ